MSTSTVNNLDKPNPSSAAKFLASAITEHCQKELLGFVEGPVELKNRITKTASMRLRLWQTSADGLSADATHVSSAPTDDAQPMHSVHEPIGIYVQTHSSYAIQIGTLDDSLFTGTWSETYDDELIRRWQGYQQYAAIARTWLSAQYTDDLCLFLVGPPGSGSSAEWDSLAQAIERNDLVCRKLIWLPSDDETRWQHQVDAFLKRSFLAEPWVASSLSRGTELDTLSTFADNVQPWIDVVNRPDFESDTRDSDEFVAALIEALLL